MKDDLYNLKITFTGISRVPVGGIVMYDGNLWRVKESINNLNSVVTNLFDGRDRVIPHFSSVEFLQEKA